jgi:hypothetical protein
MRANFSLISAIILLKLINNVIPRPIDVTNGYNRKYEVVERRPNAYFNRLPQNAQIDEVSNDDGDDDYEEQTDKPVISNTNYQSSNYYNGILSENKIKIKKRRKKIRRPCIPIQSIGSPLFSNRLKRDVDDEGGKTFGSLFGSPSYGYPYYGGGIYPPPYAGNYPNYASASTGNFQRPQQDVQNAQFRPPQYNHYGGYPCIPVSYGHVPHFGAGIGGFGGGGSAFGSSNQNGGPLGFFGNGGLLDFNSPSPSFSYPQTVIVNRPPLFSNRPSFDNGNRPSGVGEANDENRPGFWNTVVDKLSDFVSLSVLKT